MKIATQTSAELTHVAKLIENIPIAMLTTLDADGAFVSLSGHGEIDIDRARIQSLWTVFAKPWFPSGPDSNNLALLKFVPDSADYWDGPSSKMVRAFGMIASVIAGKPVAMGKHGSHTTLSASTQAAAPAPQT